MSYQDRLTSPGPARDDPLLGETTEYSGEQQAQNVGSTAKGEAANVASTAKGEAANVASTAKEEARNVAQTAQGQARKLAGDARTELKGQADSQVNRLADGISQISQQLRSMGTNGEPGPVADIASEAAERAQEVADRLRQGGVDDALAQVRSLGRNRPGLFLLGAFGVGLVAGRVVRNLAQDPTEGDGYRTNQAYDSGYSGTSGYGNAGYATTAYDSYAAPAPAVGGEAGTLPPADPASAAYGAPATPDYAEGTAPVGEQRWGT
jgi:hypothetical protein